MLQLKIIYRFLPESLRFSIRQLVKFFLYKIRFVKLKSSIIFNREIKMILGAALTSQKGWHSTNEEWLDISNEIHWKRLFSKKNNLIRVVAEHVLEHLTSEDMEKALDLIFIYLRKNGTLRIAVPDGNNPDPEYKINTGINGIGADASDHKQFITYEFIKDVLEKVGFKCYIREGFLSNGQLINDLISNELGFIKRSRSNIALNNKKVWNFKDANTSLIIDAYKI